MVCRKKVKQIGKDRDRIESSRVEEEYHKIVISNSLAGSEGVVQHSNKIRMIAGDKTRQDSLSHIQVHDT